MLLSIVVEGLLLTLIFRTKLPITRIWLTSVGINLFSYLGIVLIFKPYYSFISFFNSIYTGILKPAPGDVEKPDACFVLHLVLTDKSQGTAMLIINALPGKHWKSDTFFTPRKKFTDGQGLRISISNRLRDPEQIPPWMPDIC